MKTLEIGLCVSPSKILSIDEIKVTRVLISYGGGMGGSKETFYVTNIDKMADSNLGLTLFNDRVIIQNPTFIVNKEEIKLIKVVTDSTAHTNYNDKKCKKSIITQYFWAYLDEKFIQVNNYNDKMNERKIHSDIVMD